jgi:hypothetical protein
MDSQGVIRTKDSHHFQSRSFLLSPSLFLPFEWLYYCLLNIVIGLEAFRKERQKGNGLIEALSE